MMCCPVPLLCNTKSPHDTTQSEKGTSHNRVSPCTRKSLASPRSLSETPGFFSVRYRGTSLWVCSWITRPRQGFTLLHLSIRRRQTANPRLTSGMCSCDCPDVSSHSCIHVRDGQTPSSWILDGPDLFQRFDRPHDRILLAAGVLSQAGPMLRPPRDTPFLQHKLSLPV